MNNPAMKGVLEMILVKGTNQIQLSAVIPVLPYQAAPADPRAPAEGHGGGGKGVPVSRSKPVAHRWKTARNNKNSITKEGSPLKPAEACLRVTITNLGEQDQFHTSTAEDLSDSTYGEKSMSFR